MPDAAAERKRGPAPFSGIGGVRVAGRLRYAGGMDTSRELIATMAVVAAGALLGRAQIRGIRLDMAAMILVGAAAARMGVHLSPVLGLFGLLLFVYAVGVEAGPSLRSVHRRDLRLIVSALVILLCIFSATLFAGRLLGTPTGICLGVIAGFFSSGAALALVESHMGQGAAAGGFAITAPIATLMIMLVVQVWNARVRACAARELAEWNERMGRDADPPVRARIRVSRADASRPTLREMDLPCEVLWLTRGNRSLSVNAGTRVESGDVLHVAGTAGQVRRVARALGRLEHERDDASSDTVAVRKFFVSNPAAIGVPLRQLSLRSRYAATIARVRRSGVNLAPRPGFRFRWGDRVQVSVPLDREKDVRAFFGDDGAALEASSFPRAALVIFAGGMLGGLPFQVMGAESVRLGPAFGVLSLSLLTSALHRTGPLIWSQPFRTVNLLRQIGLPLFLVEVGNASYENLVRAWLEHGARLVGLTLVPMTIVVVLVLAAGRVLRLGPLATLTLVPPVCLNTPAYNLVQNEYRERLPSYVYAVTYPFVSIGMLLLFMMPWR